MDKAERLYPTGRHKTLALSNKKKPSFWVGCSSPLISLSLSLARLGLSACPPLIVFFFFTLLCSSSSSSSSTTLRLFPPPHSAFSPPLTLSGAFRLRFCWKTRQGGKRQQKEDEERTERERETAGKKKTTHRIACFVFACFPFVCFLPSFLARFFIRPPPWLLRVAVFQKREEKRPERGWGKGAGEEWVKEEQESR